MRQLITGGIAMAMAITANAAELTAKENAIVDIGAAVARGEQDKLGAAFKAGFDAGLTLSETKELVGQLYAYCGFPRALNAAATLMKIEGYGLTRRRGEAESAENENGGKIRNGGSFVLGDKALEIGTANQTKLCGGQMLIVTAAEGFGSVIASAVNGDRFMKAFPPGCPI